jgi:hypothetical protein
VRWVCVLLLPGCLIGGGPVLAVRKKSEVALGWEASWNLLAAGIEGGNTYSLSGGRSAGYAALRGTVPLNPTNDPIIGIDDQTSPHVNFMLGYGGPDGHNGLAAGLAPMMVFGERDNCNSEAYVFTLTLGVRTLGGMTELYVAPKGNVYFPFPCD